MDHLLYYAVRGLISVLQSFPVTWVARLGRAGGGLAYRIDGRHRRVAIQNLEMCFGGEKTPEEIRALAHENFRRIGENFACAVKTSSMSRDQIRDYLEVTGAEKALPKGKSEAPTSRVVAIGHFGNFELFAHAVREIPGYRGATTYRALKGMALNRLLLELRERTGCLYFERRTEGAALRAALHNGNVILGLLADQHSGGHGLRLPFLGHECTTSKAPAVFALRFHLALHTAICFRTRLGHWRVEVGNEIPTHEGGQPRPPRDIMLDVNRAFEEAVRRDPANWFWVHKRWKPAKVKVSAQKPKAEADELEFEGSHEGGPDRM